MLGYEQISLEEDEFTTQWKAIATEAVSYTHLKFLQANWKESKNRPYCFNISSNKSFEKASSSLVRASGDVYKRQVLF